MSWIEALLLGIIQGLTEFLPISSSGHLELGHALLGIKGEGNLTFVVAVHGATVLSTIVVLWDEIIKIIKGASSFKCNESSKYVIKLVISMIPVVIVGLLLEDKIESLFSGNIVFVGTMLLVTSALLAFANYAKDKDKEITYKDSLIIGIAQAFAVLPGISRAGTTISAGLILGNKRSKVAEFSFLMVLVPILGANVKKIIDMSGEVANTDFFVLGIGFVAAFVAGVLACKLMLRIVRNKSLIGFSVYCAIIGLTAILSGLLL
jgi:undecaprenyl-diphosphatase